MERSHDPAVVNAIMSEAFGQPMDFSKQMAGDDTFAMIGAHGCMLFVGKPGVPGHYSLTMGIKPSGRGAWATSFVDTVLDFMFTKTDAQRLWACVLRERHEVIMLAAHARGIEIEHSRSHSFASVTRDRWSAAHDQVA